MENHYIIREGKYIAYAKPFKFGFKYIKNCIENKIKGLGFKILLGGLNWTETEAKRETEYEVSICAIFKNEAPYLREWIEYHRIVGIGHFYLYDNNSTDNYFEILKPYIDVGIVTLIKWVKDQDQMAAYRHCIMNYREKSRWIGFIDIDEFVVPDEKDTVPEILQDFDNRPSVLVYWLVFGSGGVINRKKSQLVIETFFVCAPKLINTGKIFYNTKYKFDYGNKNNYIFHHLMWCKYKGKEIPTFNIFDEACFFFEGITFAKKRCPMHINHYLTKSYSEYCGKEKKGDVFFQKNPHNYDHFLSVEKLCVSTDYSIFKYISKLKLSLNNKT